MPWYAVLLLVLAVLIVPFVLGGQLARRLRMPDYGWKIGVILFAFFAGVIVVVFGWPPKLGIDLSGGVILVYEVGQQEGTERKEPLTSAEMDKLVTAVSMRVNPSGVKEVTIRRRGTEQIEIIIPEVDENEANRIADIISRAGTLEFRILANNRDHTALIEKAKQLGDDPRQTAVMGKDDQGNEVREAWFVPMKLGNKPEDKKRVEGVLRYREIYYRMVKEGGREVPQVLVVNDKSDVTGQYLTNASEGVDRYGKRCVNFRFDARGAQKFAGLTGANLPEQGGEFTRKLGIILDGALNSAPSIQSTIADRGEITGDFAREEIEDLVNVLNAGSLPTALSKDPISRLISGPRLGRDTIHKSAVAMIISSILVPLFMVWYYRFSGGVAVVALGLNMLLLMAVMIAVGARFTLTGLAGLALTIGMAVDNNVLLYERLREEIDRGATLRMAIRNAFHRAGAVIIDTNSTHLIAATVLYVVGTEQVKGFAVTFWLGAAISIFTAVFVARVIFEIAERQRWLTQAKMLKLIGLTNIDFMRLFPFCGTLSVVVTVVGLAVAVVRGQGLFDIDFTGGVSVQTLFNQDQDIAEIRHRLRDLSDLAVSDVHITGEQPNRRFVIDTSEPSLEKVQQLLVKEFPGKLVTNSVEYSPPEEIAPTKPAAKQPPSAKPKPTAPEKPAAPDSKAQSRSDLPPESVLAVADPPPLLLAQNDPDPRKTGPPGESKSAEKPGAEEKAVPAADTEEKPITKEEPKAKEEADAEEKAKPPARNLEPYAGGTSTRLTFGVEVNHKTAEDTLSESLRACKITVSDLGVSLPSWPLLTEATSACIAPSKWIRFDLGNEEGYVPGDGKAYISWDLKIQLSPAMVKTVLMKMHEELQGKPFFPASTTVGGAVAAGTRNQAFVALFASWTLIILYLWVRFQNVAFGLAAVIALIHDVLVALGAIAVSYYLAPYLGFLMIDPFKINLPIVAALMTIVGYSVNDTIVVFDRIREVRGKDPRLTRQMVNDSTNQTLSRTLLTSFTVLVVVVILYFFGGEALHGFAFALLIGVITGTYSSIYVAAPILLWLIHPPKLKGPKQTP